MPVHRNEDKMRSKSGKRITAVEEAMERGGRESTGGEGKDGGVEMGRRKEMRQRRRNWKRKRSRKGR